MLHRTGVFVFAALALRIRAETCDGSDGVGECPQLGEDETSLIQVRQHAARASCESSNCCGCLWYMTGYTGDQQYQCYPSVTSESGCTPWPNNIWCPCTDTPTPAPAPAPTPAPTLPTPAPPTPMPAPPTSAPPTPAPPTPPTQPAACDQYKCCGCLWDGVTCYPGVQSEWGCTPWPNNIWCPCSDTTTPAPTPPTPGPTPVSTTTLAPSPVPTPPTPPPSPTPPSPTPPAACPQAQAILDTYGAEIGLNGQLFNLGGSEAFYKWNSFQTAVCTYNEMASSKGDSLFLDEDTMDKNGLTLVAFMANLEVETLHWTACKERVRMADGTCPCQWPDCVGGCSGGKIDSYTSAKASAAGFTVVTCNGKTAPTKGCVDFWGNQVANPEWCWWGRGATQLTWPGNYDTFAAIVKDASGTDICEDPDSICDDDMIAWLTAVAYWKKNEAPWLAAYTFESSLQVIRPADTSANPARRANWDAWTVALGLQQPTPAPGPSEGSTTVQPGEGCWNIADRVCPGQGNSWASLICDPSGCSPAPGLGATVKYNCNGCR